MESGGKGDDGGGGEIVHPSPLVCTFSVVPALLQGRCVECGSLMPQRISSGDLNILCRLLLTVPRLVSLFHGCTMCGSPFTRLRPSSQALSVGKEGTWAGREFLAPRSPSRCLLASDRGTTVVGAGVAVHSMFSCHLSDPTTPVFPATQSSRIGRPSFFVARPHPPMEYILIAIT
ncbi:hypothetical protein NDU88_002977 [Pleurodeles waltl]|uniref:Uncharacterized protein n=1 Tax=Pleurodeles waltl TaxID=8319 RepID=A0AAV7UYP4_PLEWA|nr:hypothetical protein NDU88_002977 [Pleurodeles waltl]